MSPDRNNALKKSQVQTKKDTGRTGPILRPVTSGV